MTIEQLKQALHNIDLLLRPQILFLHPDEYVEVIDAIPDIEEQVKIVSTKAVDKGHAILMDRSWLED